MQMLHPDGSAPARPIDVPVLIGALGPKGRAVAENYDGVFATTTLEGLEPGAFDWVAYLYWGTVLDADEDVSSDAGARRCRARVARSPTTPPTSCTAVTPCPTSRAARSGSPSSTSAREDERHLDVHVGHCIHLNDADRAAWAVTGGALLPSTTVTGTADEVKARIDELGEQGVTEVVYQPCGPDIRRELETMYAAANG